MSSPTRQPAKHRRLTKAAGLTALGVVVAFAIAIPVLCYYSGKYTYSYARYGTTPGQRARSLKRRGRTYTEKEWQNIKTRPRPEPLVLEVPETPEQRDAGQDRQAIEEDDQIMGDSPLQLGQDSKTQSRDARPRKWKPKGVFRFIDLPEEIQLLVLEQLVVDSPGTEWSVCAGFCKYGFFRNRTVRASSDQEQRQQENEVVIMANTCALWRTNSTGTALSLLLASREMHRLTNAALAGTFSGRFRFHARQRTSQLDAPWPWDAVTSQSLIVHRNEWLFHLVRTLETPHTRSVWQDVLSIMPNLEKIMLTPRPLMVKCEDHWEGSPQLLLSSHWLFLSGQTVPEAVVTAGQHWIEWCKKRESEKKKTVPISMVVDMSCSGPDGTFTDLIVQVQLWPEIGLVERDDHAVLTVKDPLRLRLYPED